jgi:hypothetical protein
MVIRLAPVSIGMHVPGHALRCPGAETFREQPGRGAGPVADKAGLHSPSDPGMAIHHPQRSRLGRMSRKSTSRRSTWSTADIDGAEAWWRRKSSGRKEPVDRPETRDVPPGPAAADKVTDAAAGPRDPGPSRARPASGTVPRPAPDGRDPAVPAYRSVHSEYLVCLECGERHRDLEPHLADAHGLDPVSYRKRWNLPEDYSMVCPWDRMWRG